MAERGTREEIQVMLPGIKIEVIDVGSYGQDARATGWMKKPPPG
jgi:hypothetical protein